MAASCTEVWLTFYVILRVDWCPSGVGPNDSHQPRAMLIPHDARRSPHLAGRHISGATMADLGIEARIEELDLAIAELKGIGVQGGAGGDVTINLIQKQQELEAEQAKLRAVLRRVGERS